MVVRKTSRHIEEKQTMQKLPNEILDLMLEQLIAEDTSPEEWRAWTQRLERAIEAAEEAGYPMMRRAP